MSIPVVLSARYLTKTFKTKKASFTAVDGISFELKEGEILGILGPNGAGKTTTIEMILGTLQPSSGTIIYFGRPLHSTILQSISHASAYHKLPASLTVEENLKIIGYLYGLSASETKNRIQELIHSFRLEPLLAKKAGTLSSGQMTLVMLVKAFLSHPRIVLLDEPTASLDPDIATKARDFILKEQQEHRISIILTSHNMQEVAQMCNRALVLQKGKIIQEDTPEKLAKSVALTEISLIIESNLKNAILAIDDNKWPYTLVDGQLKLQLDHSELPLLLKTLTLQGVEYSQLEIEKPTLEDYFLHISRD